MFNLSVIFSNGYHDRLPNKINKHLLEKPWKYLKDKDQTACYGKKGGCKFNTESEKKIYIVGDSHMAAIMYGLKDLITKKGYQFITSTYGDCFYYPGFNRVRIKTDIISKECNNDYFLDLKKLINEKNSIIIFGARLPVHLSGYKFDNKEGGSEGGKWEAKFVPVGEYSSIEESFIKEVSDLSKENRIILIYPVPEVGWNVPSKLWIDRKNKFRAELSNELITTSFKVFEERTKSSFELLNNIYNKNIYRVYPHKLFCNTNIMNRCVANDNNHLFYADDDHPSQKGAEMINSLIIEEINKIEKENFK